VIVAALASAFFASTSLTMKQGAIPIDPPELLPLGGYTARGGKVMEPGGEHLFARATLVETGQETWAIVVADMLTIPASLAREVQSRIPYKLFLVATHTHCAPDSQMLNDRMTFSIPGIASYKSRWLEWYADTIATGIRDLANGRGTEVLRIGVGQRGLPLNRARRLSAWVDEVGTRIDAVTYEGVIPVWFHYAAHPVFWGPERNQTSEDWPGAVTSATGAAVIPGAIGDVSPRAEGETPDQKIANFAKVVEQRFETAKFRAFDPTPTRWVQVPLPLGEVHAHPDFAISNRIPDPLAQSLAKKFAPTEAHVTAFRIGKLAVVGIPGEPTSELGRSIKEYGRRIGFDPVLVCSHVNGWIGYILSAQDYARGGYEATLAMHGPDQGAKTVEAGCEALRQLAR
jgi:neutral ceramidase